MAIIAARDSKGNPLFTSAEFLTSQQLASFFSRLAAKGRLPDFASGSDEEKLRVHFKSSGRQSCKKYHWSIQ